ncbi:MAG: asparagine synthase (glutamine-hydrolyzing) [Flavobacteriaceae bacterium]|nr:asparagine synthase (glutamine-hydrolyzing) [Flavobacteriaceae bacterium]
MCGIFGFYLSRRLKDFDIQNGIKGLKQLSHRGPDDSGYWFDKENGVFIGHNRLSIIDISKTNSQPMIDGDTVISYNGEIYNFLDIKRKFRHEITSYRTTGDTEVLLKLWKLKKIKTFDELDGMFAFAIYEKKTLSLAVDFFGEKPLYYFKVNDGIYFSSEPLPIINLFNPDFENNLRSKMEFKIFGYINHPKTGYENLYKLGPGSILIASKKNNKIELSKKKYWDPPKRIFKKGNIRGINKNEIKSIKEILIESLNNRMLSDVPLGLFMSSGIDSVLMGCLIKKELNKDIHAYTVKFDKKIVHDESFLAKEIAAEIGIDHEILETSQSQDYNIFKMKELYSNEVNDNPTIFSFYEMSLLAKKSIKVALSGLGGDEIFLGYNRYDFYYKYMKWVQILRKFKGLIKILNNLTFNKYSKINSLYNNLLKVSKESIYVNYKNLNQLQGMNYELIDEISNAFFSGDLNYFLEEVSKYDLNYTMPNSYIPAMELGSMKASIEIRSPFLNKKLYKYVVENIDQRSLMHFGAKFILKTILKEYLASKFIDQPKRGFIFPIKNLVGDDFINSNQAKILLREKLLNSYIK